MNSSAVCISHVITHYLMLEFFFEKTQRYTGQIIELLRSQVLYFRLYIPRSEWSLDVSVVAGHCNVADFSVVYEMFSVFVATCT